MLTRKRPESIATKLTVNGQGETFTMNLTYFNRNQDEMEAQLEKVKGEENAGILMLLYYVKEWEAEYPLSTEGVIEAEKDRPGLIMAITYGFHKARGVELVKN